MIRVLLGYRRRLIRGALAALLSGEHDLEMVGELDRAEDVMSVAAQRRPNVVVLDSSLSDTSPIDYLCRRVYARGVLVVVDRDSVAGSLLALARHAPRVGLIASDASPAELVDAVRQLARGRPVLDPGLAAAALRADANPLTVREQEVLRLVATGVTAHEVARTLSLSAGTVRNHLSHILAKMGARTRIEAIRIAQDAGWI